MLYTPIELKLKGLFHGYTDDHYVLLKPLTFADRKGFDKIASAEDQIKLCDALAERFIRGVGLNAEGNNHEMTKDEFRAMLDHIFVLAIKKLRPIQMDDKAFLDN